MTIDGMGPHEIAKALAADKVERPSYYMNRCGIVPYRYPMDEPYTWSSSTVSSIISKPESMGHTVNFRFYKESYKDKHTKPAPKEDWVIFPDTHEGIIESEVWENAQRLRKTVKRTDSLGTANPLTGKMFCADCGGRMYNHRKPYETPLYTNPNTGKTYMRKPSDVYVCATHSRGNRRFNKACSLHHIRTEVVNELVLDAIRGVSAYVRGSEEEFTRRVREASAVQREDAAKSHRKRISKNEKRIAELDMLFRKTYEDNAIGKLSDERFTQLSGAYETEQADLKQQNAVMKAEVDAFNADGARADRFIELVKKYTDFSELTPGLINEFVDKILVYEPDRSSGKRVQKVDIYQNLIGMFPQPLAEKERDPAEIEEERRLDALRAKRREYNRRYQAKRKVKDRMLIPPNPKKPAEEKPEVKRESDNKTA
jgi:hypothetical protein